MERDAVRQEERQGGSSTEGEGQGRSTGNERQKGTGKR